MFRKFSPCVCWLALLLVCLACAAPAWADGLIVIHNPPQPVPGHFSFAPLEVSYHKVECAIDDQVAVTSVDQEFVNPNNATLEGTYIFPVPKDVRIDKFTMDINGKPVEAELLPAEKARGIYEEIVRKSKDPALLEYAGRDMFKVRIFPIEPYGKKRITLKYTELLPQANNLLHYHYTLNTEKFSSKPLKNVSLKITIKSPLPLTNIYSPSHDVEVRKDPNASQATVGYEAKDVRPDTDFHLYIGRKAAPVGISVLTYKPELDKDGYFVLLAAPTVSASVKSMPKDVVFVMDTSGSMADEGKIDQAKKALKFCINSLNKDDRFDIVRFSTEAEPYFKSLTTASDENKKKAVDYASELKASGGTAIMDALNAAYAEKPDSGDRLFMIVFMTDGQPTVGEQHPDKIVAGVKNARNAGNVRIFSFGVGHDVNTKLLDSLADQTKGYSQYVLPKEDIEVAMSNFFSKVQDPVIAGLKLDMGAVPISKLYPKDLPDLFKGDQIVAFGTYGKAGSAAVVLTGNVNGKAEKFAQDVTFPDQTDSKNEWIAKLWATRRVGYLLDEIRLHGESKELKDEATELARKFGIVTPYTAMLIIEDERARGVPVATRSLRDMEEDRATMDGARTGVASLGKESGKQAVANAVNGDYYKKARSLDGVAQAAQQKDERLAFEGQSGGTLDRRLPAPAAGPMTSSAANSGWVGGVANNSSTSSPNGGTIQNGNDAQSHGYRVVTNYAQQNRVVSNRTFYLNGNQWSDARVQNLDAKKAKTVKITFGTDAYFDLLKNHPEAAQWMSLGNNVTFEISGTIYEITEDTTPANKDAK